MATKHHSTPSSGTGANDRRPPEVSGGISGQPEPGQRTMTGLGRLTKEDREKALDLPVVQELMKTFDLSLMSIKHQPENSEKPSESHEAE